MRIINEVDEVEVFRIVGGHVIVKNNRYYPDYQARKVFDDLLGFHSLCDNYDDVLDLRRS